MELRYNKSRDDLGLLWQDRAVLELLLQAKSRSMIAEQLEMPFGSVNTSCNRIYKTLDCHSLPELILKCSQLEQFSSVV